MTTYSTDEALQGPTGAGQYISWPGLFSVWFIWWVCKGYSCPNTANQNNGEFDHADLSNAALACKVNLVNNNMIDIVNSTDWGEDDLFSRAVR